MPHIKAGFDWLRTSVSDRWLAERWWRRLDYRCQWLFDYKVGNNEMVVLALKWRMNKFRMDGKFSHQVPMASCTHCRSRSSSTSGFHGSHCRYHTGVCRNRVEYLPKTDKFPVVPLQNQNVRYDSVCDSVV